MIVTFSTRLMFLFAQQLVFVVVNQTFVLFSKMFAFTIRCEKVRESRFRAVFLSPALLASPTPFFKIFEFKIVKYAS